MKGSIRRGKPRSRGTNARSRSEVSRPACRKRLRTRKRSAATCHTVACYPTRACPTRAARARLQPPFPLPLHAHNSLTPPPPCLPSQAASRPHCSEAIVEAIAVPVRLHSSDNVGDGAQKGTRSRWHTRLMQRKAATSHNFARGASFSAWPRGRLRISSS
eukprot:6180041-Pleurochrysis_carterae.AAC.2